MFTLRQQCKYMVIALKCDGNSLLFYFNYQSFITGCLIAAHLSMNIVNLHSNSLLDYVIHSKILLLKQLLGVDIYSLIFEHEEHLPRRVRPNCQRSSIQPVSKANSTYDSSVNKKSSLKKVGKLISLPSIKRSLCFTSIGKNGVKLSKCPTNELEQFSSADINQSTVKRNQTHKNPDVRNIIKQKIINGKAQPFSHSTADYKRCALHSMKKVAFQKARSATTAIIFHH